MQTSQLLYALATTSVSTPPNFTLLALNLSCIILDAPRVQQIGYAQGWVLSGTACDRNKLLKQLVLSEPKIGLFLIQSQHRFLLGGGQALIISFPDMGIGLNYAKSNANRHGTRVYVCRAVLSSKFV